ncbi:MAG: hypothetical protein GTO02_19510, partial [Candidatus Dadabacteria bacterium]|nr:hypothetical protein [Candidatus Dadabacteria bacterium]
DPKLSDVKDQVERDWKYDLQKELEQEYFRKKLSNYDVQIQWSEKPGSRADKGK